MSTDLLRHADRIDDAIDEVFAALSPVDVRFRYLVYYELLRRKNSVALATDPDEMKALVDKVFGGEALECIKDHRPVLEDFLTAVVKPTYTVASYWSPVDQLRRSVVHREAEQREEARITLAYALAFYTLTLVGEHQATPIYSLVHYTATKARRKIGVHTCFMDHAPDTEEPWLSIPPSLNSITRLLGIDDGIEALLEDNSVSASALQEALVTCLMYDRRRRVEDLDFRGFAGGIIRNFDEQVERLPADVLNQLGDRQAKLSAWLGSQDRNHSLTLQATASIVATQLLWRRACPSDFMYMFPVHVSETCCVLTVGRLNLLDVTESHVCSDFARSLFTQALFRDFASKEIAAESTRRSNVFRRLIGHNLSKILVRPAIDEIAEAKTALLDEKRRESAETAEAVIQCLDRLDVLFNHYDRFLQSFLPKDEKGALFSADYSTLDFNKHIYPKAVSAFELMRSQVLDSHLRRHLVLRREGLASCRFIGHRAFVIEMLFNLISNAVDAVDPKDVRANIDRAEVKLSVGKLHSQVGCAAVTITVSDRGVGFSPEVRKAYEDAFQQLQSATREEFFTVLESLLQTTLSRHAREEHLGIGLMFCEAYLCSLRWDPLIQRAGHVSIESTQAVGSAVTIVLPCLDVPVEQFPVAERTLESGSNTEGVTSHE